MPALHVTTDLMALAAADGAARRVGVELTTAKPADAVAACQANPPSLIAIDLTGSIEDLSDFVASLRAASPAATLLAYGPHVHEARLATAKEAGCDAVISRGQFHRRVEALLSEHTES